jgi:sec-independent protein translocase protein TatA
MTTELCRFDCTTGAFALWLPCLRAPNPSMNFLGLGIGEMILILVVLLLFFGKDKLPELARSIGKSFKELRSGFEMPKDEPAKPNEQKELPKSPGDVPR